MAKDGNTFAKRQRETLKRQKAEEKRLRRRKRKEQVGSVSDITISPRDESPGSEPLDAPAPSA